MVNFGAAVVVTVPTVHTPVLVSKLPWLTVVERMVSPAGNASRMATLVAGSRPALFRVTVNVTVSPTLGVGLVTALVTRRSERCGVSVALAVLLPVLGSNWSALAVAVLVWGAELSTRARSVKVAS